MVGTRSEHGTSSETVSEHEPEGKLEEIIALQKGDMSVYEYTEKFVKILASFEDDCITEEGKIYWYANELPFEYANRVRQTTTFRDAMVVALFFGGIMEGRVTDEVQSEETERCDESQVPLGTRASCKGEVHSIMKKPCGKCGKEHIGECLYGTHRCYTCGQEGHKMANCVTLQCYTCGQEGHRMTNCDTMTQKKTNERQRIGEKRKFGESSSAKKRNCLPSNYAIKGEFRCCKKCGKRHIGECKKGTKDCFKCGQFGHKAMDCRLKNAKEVVCFTCREVGHYRANCPRSGK